MNSPLQMPPVDANSQVPSGPSTLGKWWSNAKQLVPEFLPPPLKRAAEKGLVGTFISLVVIFVILPPVIALLAATTIGWLGESNNSLVKTFHNWYVHAIQDGFSIEEVTERSHANLDYFQSFGFNLSKNEPVHTQRISIKENQQASIAFSHLSAGLSSQKCLLLEKDVTLVEVSLSKQPLGSFAKDHNDEISINPKWWKLNGPKFESTTSELAPLIFKLSEDARKKLPDCTVRVEGSIRVYKRIFTKLSEASK